MSESERKWELRESHHQAQLLVVVHSRLIPNLSLHWRLLSSRLKSWWWHRIESESARTKHTRYPNSFILSFCWNLDRECSARAISLSTLCHSLTSRRKQFPVVIHTLSHVFLLKTREWERGCNAKKLLSGCEREGAQSCNRTQFSFDHVPWLDMTLHSAFGRISSQRTSDQSESECELMTGNESEGRKMWKPRPVIQMTGQPTEILCWSLNSTLI